MRHERGTGNESVISAISQLGPYRVDEKIGAGGMATVYRAARGPEGAEARVALKVLHPDLAKEPEHLEMFLAEGELAKLMIHAVLVPVRDTGNADGTYYMAMDLLEGLTLSELRRHYRSRNQTVPRGHAMWILAQVLDGLHFAHSLTHGDGTFANVVHRDLSPRNIFITNRGQVRLMDFGIARSIVRQGHTRAGIVKGTIPYMAPEQARAENVDRRADIFAAGVLLHELITGKPPIKPEEAEEQRRALAAMDIHIDRKRIHLKLRPVLQRALANRPDDRYENAAEFAADIRQVLTEIEPHHDPTLLGAMSGRTSTRRDSRPSEAARRERKSQISRAPREVNRHRTGHHAAVTRKAELPEWNAEWDGAQTLALVASLVFLLALCHTFITGLN